MTGPEAAAVMIGAAILFLIATWLGYSLIWHRRRRPAPRWNVIKQTKQADPGSAFPVDGDPRQLTLLPPEPETRINVHGEEVPAPVEDWLGGLEWPFPEKWLPAKFVNQLSPRPWAHG